MLSTEGEKVKASPIEAKGWRMEAKEKTLNNNIGGVGSS
jgi:hypothetical protein